MPSDPEIVQLFNMTYKQTRTPTVAQGGGEGGGGSLWNLSHGFLLCCNISKDFTFNR